MIAIIVLGILSIAALALVVGIVDAARAPAWRDVAAQRREQWEARVLALHGGVEAVPDSDSWSDSGSDDWDDD